MTDQVETEEREQPIRPVGLPDEPMQTEFRCPNQGGMFLKLLGTPDATVTETNTVQVTCRGCAKHYRESGHWATVFTVVHEFNLLGEMLSTDIIGSLV